eukprot:752542-Hanusia_phi.AAC.3
MHMHPPPPPPPPPPPRPPPPRPPLLLTHICPDPVLPYPPPSLVLPPACSMAAFMLSLLESGFGSALSIIGDPPFDEGWDTTAVILLQQVEEDFSSSPRAERMGQVMGVAVPSYPQISNLTRFLLLLFIT